MNTPKTSELRGFLQTLAPDIRRATAFSVVISLPRSKMSFAAGVRSRLDILNAQGQRSQVLLELAHERVNYVLARLRLLALTGGLNLAEISTVNGWLAGNAPAAH